jgi:hypothetical protein
LVLVVVVVVAQNRIAEPQQQVVVVGVVADIRNGYCKHLNYWLLKL